MIATGAYVFHRKLLSAAFSGFKSDRRVKKIISLLSGRPSRCLPVVFKFYGICEVVFLLKDTLFFPNREHNGLFSAGPHGRKAQSINAILHLLLFSQHTASPCFSEICSHHISHNSSMSNVFNFLFRKVFWRGARGELFCSQKVPLALFHPESYQPKYLARRPSNALPCLASSRAIS